MTVHEFYFDFLRQLTLPPALPPCRDPLKAHLYESGLSDATIDEMGAVWLSSNPTNEERELYHTFMHQKRVNEKSGAPDPLVEGILFPYHINVKEWGEFGRVRGFVWQADFVKWYQDKGQDAPRYLSPKKGNVKATSHLYILPTDQEKIEKARTMLVFVEGEKKAAKLSQELRKLDDDLRLYAVIGGAGVEQFLTSPEMHDLPIRNRICYLFFDADSRVKTPVMQAEMKLFAYLTAKGARAIKSCTWREKRGNGIDDYLVNAERVGFPPEQTVKKLIEKSVPTLRKYTPDDDYDGFPLETVCHALATVPMQAFQQAQVVEELYKLYKPAGVKKKDIARILDKESETHQHHQQEEQIKENAELVKQVFNCENPPELPKDYFFKYGNLVFHDTPLCRMFIISRYISNDSPDEQDIYLASFQNKDIMIPSDEFTNYRKIAEIFNRNQEILYDGSARMVQQYISHYWIQNRHQIPLAYYYKNTGWDRGGVFRMPSLDADGFYDFTMQQQFVKAGDAEQQREFLQEVVTDHNAGIGVLFGFAAPLTGLFGMPNYVINIYGNPGEGKSTAAYAALSLYGDYRKLKNTMNATKVGKEVACSMHKDLPVLLDEINTAGNGDGKQIAQSVIETIYGFDSGKGRSRGTVNITMRRMNEYKGLLMLTSERSLEAIFSVSKNLNVGGAYRRTLEIPVIRQRSMWNYPENGEKEFFNRMYEALGTHYGHIGAEWLLLISDPQTQEEIKIRYKEMLKAFGEEWNLKGTENLICLLKAICPEVERLLNLADGAILANLNPYLEQILAHQQEQINYQIRDQMERFTDALESFIGLHYTTIFGLCPENITPPQINGRVEKGEKLTHIYLRPNALQQICNDYGFNRDGILERLKDEKVFVPKLKTVGKEVVEEKSFNMQIGGTSGRVYHFVTPTSKAYDRADLIAEEKNEPEKIF